MAFIINGLHSQRSYSSRYGSEAPGFTLKPGGLASGLALTSSVTLVEPGCLSGTQFPHGKQQAVNISRLSPEVVQNYKHLFKVNNWSTGGSFYLQSKEVQAKKCLMRNTESRQGGQRERAHSQNMTSYVPSFHPIPPCSL